MEKQKRKQAPRHITKKHIFRVILVLIILVMLVWIVLPEVNKPSIGRSSLPDSMQPLAESLLDADAQPGIPLDISHASDIGGGTSLLLDISGVQSIDTSRICIIAETGILEPYTSIYVNGIRSSLFGYLSIESNNGFMRCVEGNLISGLHLVEFRLREAFFAEPIVIQQWAFELD